MDVLGGDLVYNSNGVNGNSNWGYNMDEEESRSSAISEEFQTFGNSEWGAGSVWGLGGGRSDYYPSATSPPGSARGNEFFWSNNIQVEQDNIVLEKSAVKLNEYDKVLDFVMKCKENDALSARRFLLETLERFDRQIMMNRQSSPAMLMEQRRPRAMSSSMMKKSGGSNVGTLIHSNSTPPSLLYSNIGSSSKSLPNNNTFSNNNNHKNNNKNGDDNVDDMFEEFNGDIIDEKIVTLVMLVPGSKNIIGHVIGKNGSEIRKLQSYANVKITIENNLRMPVGSSERRIYVIGALKNCVLTQQVIIQRINERLEKDGMKQELIRMVIPHETVRHLIGKGGTNIKKFQSLSGAHIQVDPHVGQIPGTVGRTVTIPGSQFERSKAQYLIMRQMTEIISAGNSVGWLKDLETWQGGLPQPQIESPTYLELQTNSDVVPQNDAPSPQSTLTNTSSHFIESCEEEEKEKNRQN